MISATVRGCRGSVPASGAAYARHGQATTCFEFDAGRNSRLLVDGGTGTVAIPVDADHWTVLLTHLHWDHVLGLPFFPPIFSPDHTIEFLTGLLEPDELEDAVEGMFRPPWFPVSFHDTLSKKTFQRIADEPFQIGDLHVTPAWLQHPGGVNAYRIERGGRVIVIATDTEHGDPGSDAAVRRLAEGADVLVHDAQYLEDEYRTAKKGWGHATWQAAVSVARDAGVDRLILTSHDPVRTDDGVDAIVAAAREEFPATDAAYEGMVIEA